MSSTATRKTVTGIAFCSFNRSANGTSTNEICFLGAGHDDQSLMKVAFPLASTCASVEGSIAARFCSNRLAGISIEFTICSTATVGAQLTSFSLLPTDDDKPDGAD